MTTPARHDPETLLAAAQASWPGIALDREVFLGRLDQVLAEAGPAEIRAAELYLATACAAGIAAAQVAFEERYFPVVRRAVARIRTHRDGEELVQHLRSLMFLGRGEGGPLVGRYGGRGSIESWLRVVTVREVIAEAGKKPDPAAPLTDSALEELASSNDQELDYLRRLYGPEFKGAFQAAFHGLEGADRTLLRYVYLDGLDTAALGRILRVHRTTAARQLAKVHEQLFDRTRAHLGAALEVGPAELESILKLVQSQLSVSLSRLLSEV
jgi:RNA polymerase sigma-70 factor (ECF subfamily)